jgi:H+/gluconate symporter-like permease
VGLFKKKTLPPPQQQARAKPFRFELGWRGMFGLVVVCFCLFLWMFLLGVWAGQTILLPSKENRFSQSGGAAKQVPTKTTAAPPSLKEQQRTTGP